MATKSMSKGADIIASHTAVYNTIYDGRGGVAWQDNGGLWCRGCQTEFPLECGEHIRPWPAFWEHVAAMVAKAAWTEGHDAGVFNTTRDWRTTAIKTNPYGA